MFSSPLNRMIDNMFSGTPQRTDWSSSPGTYYTYTTHHTGKAENSLVKDEDGVTVIRVVLAGVTKDDVDIEAQDGNRIVITVQRDESLKELGLATEEEFHVRVRHGFKVEDAETTLEHGILEIRLPKIDEEKGRKIPVK